MATSRTGTSKYLRNSGNVKRKARRNGLAHCPGTDGNGCPHQHELDYDTSLQPNSAETDHIIEHARGGTDDPDNLRVICRACNGARNRKQPVPVPPVDAFPTSRAW